MRRGDRVHLVELDPFARWPLERPRAPAEEHRHDVQADLVDQPGRRALPGVPRS